MEHLKNNLLSLTDSHNEGKQCLMHSASYLTQGISQDEHIAHFVFSQEEKLKGKEFFLHSFAVIQKIFFQIKLHDSFCPSCLQGGSL